MPTGCPDLAFDVRLLEGSPPETTTAMLSARKSFELTQGGGAVSQWVFRRELEERAGGKRSRENAREFACLCKR